MNTKRLYIVGFGPGSPKQMTVQAREAIESSEVIVGFTTYNSLLRKIFPDKDYLSTGMGGETERVRMAFAEADEGRTVSLVCSGDSCIYGMAGLAYELSREFTEVELETIPGVTAALSGSALLGAAVGNDLCIISLSDYHTEAELIQKRLEMAAECDMVIALYNTRSKTRPDSLRNACSILSRILPQDRVCGVAENIGREGERSETMPLSCLMDYPATMFSTVFIGNSKTQLINGKMVTPRGYDL